MWEEKQITYRTARKGVAGRLWDRTVLLKLRDKDAFSEVHDFLSRIILLYVIIQKEHIGKF